MANLLASPAATVRIGDTHLGVEARLPLSASPERSEAIRRLHSKYGTQVSSSAADWESDAYIVALDLRF